MSARFSTLLTFLTLGGSSAAPPQLTSLTVGENFLCVTSSAGQVYCRGQTLPAIFQAKIPDQQFHLLPKATDVLQSTANAQQFCQLHPKGKLQCSGSATFTSENIQQLGIGARHMCYIGKSGRVACWGENTFGQLGDGTLNRSDKPVTVNLAGPAIAVAPGASHTCALLKDQRVQCWGSNYAGQVGPKLKTRFPNPQFKSTRGQPERIFAARDGDFTCIDASGSTECWGGITGSQGQCQRRLPDSYLLPRGDEGVHKIASRLGVFGIRKDTKLTFWRPQVDCKKPVTPTFHQPAVLEEMSGGRAIDAVGRMVCSLVDDTQVKCYGTPWSSPKRKDEVFILKFPK